MIPRADDLIPLGPPLASSSLLARRAARAYSRISYVQDPIAESRPPPASPRTPREQDGSNIAQAGVPSSRGRTRSHQGTPGHSKIAQRRRGGWLRPGRRDPGTHRPPREAQATWPMCQNSSNSALRGLSRLWHGSETKLDPCRNSDHARQ